MAHDISVVNNELLCLNKKSVEDADEFVGAPLRSIPCFLVSRHMVVEVRQLLEPQANNGKGKKRKRTNRLEPPGLSIVQVDRRKAATVEPLQTSSLRAVSCAENCTLRIEPSNDVEFLMVYSTSSDKERWHPCEAGNLCRGAAFCR